MIGERPSRPQSAGVPPDDQEHARDARALRARRPLSAALFLALALLHLIPIWSVDHLPTSDGPTHLYNAWILHELIAGRDGPIARHYAIDWRPHSNWAGHVLLALLLCIVPPIVAEKLLVSGIVLLFLLSIWMYAGAKEYAFLAFPLAYHQFLQSGFYNFSLGIALYFLILAVWWRRRDRPDAKTIALIAALLLLCYFSHPLPTLLAIGSIGVLWLFTLPARTPAVHARHLLALIPVLPLLAWFALVQGTEATPSNATLADRILRLVRVDAILTFDNWQFKLGFALFAILIAFVGITAARWRRLRETDAFLVLTLAVLIIYFQAPLVIAGGMGVAQRTAIFVYLLPLPWLWSGFSRPVRVGIVTLLVTLSVGNLIFLTGRYRAIDPLLTKFIRTLDPIAPDTTVLPLLFDRRPPNIFIAVYSHMIDYVAIEKRLVDLDNYEPTTGYFPIAFQPNVPPVRIYPIEAVPQELEIEPFAVRAQHIFTWHLPLNTPIQQRIEKYYRLVSEIGGGRVYRSLILEPSIARLPKILLPVAGTVGESDLWRVEQSVRNAGQSTVHLVASTCVSRCEFDLGPGQQMPLASADQEMPFIIIYVGRGSEKDLIFSTIVYRGDSPLVEIPAVHESAFQRRKIRIPNVPFGGARLNVRAWFFGKGPDLFFYRILSHDGRVLGEKVGAVGPTAFFNKDDPTKAFPQIPPTEFVDIEVDTRSDDMRVWAFVTATDFDGGRVKLHLPSQGGM
jgi:hypothetical protein